jgi:hypothetical protein
MFDHENAGNKANYFTASLNWCTKAKERGLCLGRHRAPCSFENRLMRPENRLRGLLPSLLRQLACTNQAQNKF